MKTNVYSILRIYQHSLRTGIPAALRLNGLGHTRDATFPRLSGIALIAAMVPRFDEQSKLLIPFEVRALVDGAADLVGDRRAPG